MDEGPIHDVRISGASMFPAGPLTATALGDRCVEGRGAEVIRLVRAEGGFLPEFAAHVR